MNSMKKSKFEIRIIPSGFKEIWFRKYEINYY